MQPEIGLMFRRLDDVRRDLGMTAKRMCELMGVDPATYYRWKNGTAPANMEKLCILCRKLGISFEELVRT